MWVDFSRSTVCQSSWASKERCGNVTTVEEPQYAGSNGALKIALDMPEDYWSEFSNQVGEPEPVAEGA